MIFYLPQHFQLLSNLVVAHLPIFLIGVAPYNSRLLNLSNSLFLISVRGIFLPETVNSTSFIVLSLFMTNFLYLLGTTNSPMLYSPAWSFT